MENSHVDFQLFESLLDRLETVVSSAGGRSNIPQWIEKNTRSPTNSRMPFSFLSHEFQLQLLSDCAPHIVIQKCAQVGISEILVRYALALLSKLEGINAIYCLPSSSFARKFVTNRVDPVIEASPRLKSMLNRNADNSEMKRIGNSFLHFTGAQRDSQSISIPARALLVDEMSFADASVLSTLKSRLGHQTESERILIEFSTALFNASGISEAFQSGSQTYYMTFHDTCGQWVLAEPLDCLVLPGFDDPLIQLAPDDLKRKEVKVAEAWVKCPHCHHPISRENMADPSRRAWVPMYPDRPIHSYQIDPFAVPSIKWAPQIIGELETYRRTDRWINYCIGKPFDSADVSITAEAIEKAFTVQKVPPGSKSVYGSGIGMDVGNISHLSAGKKVGTILEVFHMEHIRQDENNRLGVTFVDRYMSFGCSQGVIDSGPDISVVKYAQGRLPYNRCFGGRFVRGKGSATMDIYDIDEVAGVLKIKRTAAINDFVGDFNAGRIRLPMGLPFETEIKEHLSRLKRVTNYDAVGEEQSVWISTGADHFAFSLIYLYLAARMCEENAAAVVAPGLVIASKVKLGGALQPVPSRFDPLSRRYAA